MHTRACCYLLGAMYAGKATPNALLGLGPAKPWQNFLHFGHLGAKMVFCNLADVSNPRGKHCHVSLHPKHVCFSCCAEWGTIATAINKYYHIFINLSTLLINALNK